MPLLVMEQLLRRLFNPIRKRNWYRWLGVSARSRWQFVKFPHLGGVIIGNMVEIGSNCQIARGALSDTVISDGCKINGLCFIAHNCFLGRNVWITGSSMLAGSTHVEENVTIYSKVIIGNNAI